MRHGLLHACVRAWMAGGVVVSTSTGHAADPGSVPVKAHMVYLVSKSGSQHWGLCINWKSENHIVGTISIWDVNS